MLGPGGTAQTVSSPPSLPSCREVVKHSDPLALSHSPLMPRASFSPLMWLLLLPGSGGRGDSYWQAESECLSSAAPSLAFDVIKTLTQAEAQGSGNVCPRSHRANLVARPGFERLCLTSE